MPIPTLNCAANPDFFSNKRVIVRLDLNVPVVNGQVTDFTRIDRCLETLNWLSERSAKIIIISHFGRPQQRTPGTSLDFLVPPLSQRLHRPVSFAPDCIGPVAQQAVDALQPGGFLLLENLRYYPEEEKNDLLFSQKLAELGDVFVNDAFSCCHRSHASIVGISAFIPSFAGKSLDEELTALNRFLTPCAGPVMAILGGAKISTKFNLIRHLLPTMDYIAVGGGMANTFLAAQGKNIGTSLVEHSFIPKARLLMEEALAKNCHFILPQDAVVTDESSADSAPRTLSVEALFDTAKIGDIGPQTVAAIKHHLEKCRTVIWNGPVGIFERPPFNKSSVQLAEIIAHLTTSSSLVSIAGGGETLACLNQANCSRAFSYTSTGGGAFLEWLEGKSLPGLHSLQAAFQEFSPEITIKTKP